MNYSVYLVRSKVFLLCKAIFFLAEALRWYTCTVILIYIIFNVPVFNYLFLFLSVRNISVHPFHHFLHHSLLQTSQLNTSDGSYFYGNVFNYRMHRGCNVRTAYPGFISSQASNWLDLGASVPCSTFPVSVWMTLTGSSLIWLVSSMSCTNK